MKAEIGGMRTDNASMKIEIGSVKGEIRLLRLRWMGGILVAIQLSI